MKKSLRKTIQITPKIWAMLLVESVIASLLYTILSLVGISKSTSFFITLGIAFALAILGLLLFPKSLLLLKNEDEAFTSKLSMPNQISGGYKNQGTKEDESPTVVESTQPKQRASMVRPSEPIEIFLAYSHTDRLLANQLRRHLKSLEREARIQIWSDGDIHPGMNWKEEINKHLMASNIILMLVSPDFIASDYVYTEMEHALERSRRGEVTIIPILLRYTSWEETPLHEFQSLPANGEPVVSPKWHDIDKALSNVANGIQKTVNELLSEDDGEHWRERLGNA